MKEIQKVILNIFKNVKQILYNFNIPYYAIGGTCLGAIRHHGFIPWDDDLDIAVPIEYWDRLIEVMKSELPEYLYLYTPDNVKPYHYVWLKVCDKRTTFIEKSEFDLKEAYKGVFIDIMPIGGIPAETKDREKFIQKLRHLDSYNNHLRFSDSYSTLKSFLGRLPFRILSRILPYNYYSKKYMEILKEHPFVNSSFVGYTWHPEWLPRLVFPKSYFNDGIDVQFEDTLIKVPQDYHRYLSQQFGNYMQLPPENRREVHIGFIDLNKPYSFYYKNRLN